MTAPFEEGTAFAELQKRLVLSKEEMAEQRVLTYFEEESRRLLGHGSPVLLSVVKRRIKEYHQGK